MFLKNNLTDTFFKVLFYLLCVLYILFYMPFGFEGTDTGYIFGSSWNIFNGQFPHRDFIYTRPAIPAYLHTVFLFISESYGYILDRSFFYIQVFMYSFLGSKLLMDHFSIKSISLLYFIAIMAAMFSIHNYPPMGWNTIDGVFFCTIGLYLILKKNSSTWLLLVGSLCFVLGVFSKQSFYFMPIFLFVYLLFSKNYYRLKFFCLFGFIFVSTYLGFKYFTNSLTPFFEQTFQRTSGSRLTEVGIKTYYLALKFNSFYVLGLLIAIWAGIKYIGKSYVYVFINLVLAAYFIYVFYHDNDTRWSVIKYAFQLLFIGSTLYCLYMARKDKRNLLLLLLLGLSWSASISNGYQTPIHFSLPMVFCLYLFFFKETTLTDGNIKLKPQKHFKFIAGGIIFLFLGTFYYGYQTLYRDAAKKELNYNMEEIFPQLKFIKSDKATFEKYSELKSLVKTYPNFTVIPSMTLAHYLTNTINPIGTDWPLDVEINDESQKLVNQLLVKKSFVFVENSEFTPEELKGYEIKTHIEAHWRLVEKGAYFSIYAPD